VEKIVEGKMSKFYQEVCLNEQPFIKDQSIKVSDFITAEGERLGEKIAVRRFAPFEVAVSFSLVIGDWEHGPEGRDVAGIAVKKPKAEPKQWLRWC
jgi:translation elongation factor EF-Ts